MIAEEPVAFLFACEEEVGTPYTPQEERFILPARVGRVFEWLEHYLFRRPLPDGWGWWYWEDDFSEAEHQPPEGPENRVTVSIVPLDAGRCAFYIGGNLSRLQEYLAELISEARALWPMSVRLVGRGQATTAPPPPAPALAAPVELPAPVAQQETRDAAIYRRLLAGETAKQLATAYKLTERRIYQIVGAESRKTGKGSGNPD